MTSSNAVIFLGPLLWYEHLIPLICSKYKIFRDEQKSAYSLRNEMYGKII